MKAHALTRARVRSPFNYLRALANEQRRRKQWRKPVEASVGMGWRLATDVTARLAAAAGARLGLTGGIEDEQEREPNAAEAASDEDADDALFPI